MAHSLAIVLSGGAIFFAVGMIAKYARYLRGKESSPDIAGSTDSVLLHGTRHAGGVGGNVQRGRRVAQYLRASTERVDACLQSLTDVALAADLIDLQKTGNVQVRVIIHGPDEADSRVPLLLDNGIRVKRGEKMQHSFMMVDGTTLLAGSLGSASVAHHDCTLVTSTPLIATTFAMEFERLWEKFD